MTSFKVAAIQSALRPKDEERAIQETISQIRTSVRRHSARLVCLPEHWLLEKILSGDSDPLYDTFRNLARSLDCYINMGGIFERFGDSTFFLSPTISPRGEIISKQKKAHLFRRENDLAIGGNSFEPFKIDGITTGVMVCHDVVFPESARTLVLKGAELLLNPSLITSLGIKPWRSYLIVRALENRVPIIAPNPSLGIRVPGKSELLGLTYDKKQGIMQVKELAKPVTGKHSYIVDVSLDEEFASLRKERLSERKPEAYSNG
jgi:omega-amidase